MQSIWQHSQRLVNDFIDCSKLDKSNTHLVKQVLVNDLCMYFMKVGRSLPLTDSSARCSAAASRRS